MLQAGLELTKQPGGPAPRAENFLDDLQIVERMIVASKESWNALYEAMQSWTFSRAKTCKGDEYDKSLMDRAQKLRDDAKKKLKAISRWSLFKRKPESFLRDMTGNETVHYKHWYQIVQAFSDKFKTMKEEKGLVDFADLEHYCLDILLDPSAKREGNHRSF